MSRLPAALQWKSVDPESGGRMTDLDHALFRMVERGAPKAIAMA